MRYHSLFASLAALVMLPACVSSGFPSDADLKAWLESQKRPAEADAYSDFLVGRYAALSNDPGTAARKYSAAVDTAPSQSGLAERAVFTALLAGEYEQGARLADKASSLGSEGPLVRLTLGVDALKSGQPETARDILGAADYGPFNRMIARGVSAWSVLDTEGPEAAEAYLMDGLTGDDRLDGATLYIIGLVQMSAGDEAQALKTLETVWESGARLAIGVEAHARLLAANGERERAREMLQMFRDEVGVNASIERLRADLEAGREIQVKRLTPKEGAALSIYVPAAALRMQTQDDLSGVYFVLALALDPDLHVARSLWASALADAGRTEEALSILSEVPQSSVFYATTRGQMAWALQRTGQGEAALQVAADALAADPDRDLKIQLADLYRSLERWAEADQVLTEIITADASDARATPWRIYFARGAARERLGRWPEAESDLRRALQLNPDSATVLNYLGYSYVDRGVKIDEGFEMIRKAIALNPRSGAIVDSLGWGHYKLGQYDLAVRFLERAVELEPADPVINDHLGDAYWKTGRKLEAGFQWQRALSLDPDESERLKIELKLERGLETDMLQAADASSQ